MVYFISHAVPRTLIMPLVPKWQVESKEKGAGTRDKKEVTKTLVVTTLGALLMGFFTFPLSFSHNLRLFVPLSLWKHTIIFKNASEKHYNGSTTKVVSPLHGTYYVHAKQQIGKMNTNNRQRFGSRGSKPNRLQYLKPKPNRTTKPLAKPLKKIQTVKPLIR